MYRFVPINPLWPNKTPKIAQAFKVHKVYAPTQKHTSLD